MAYVPTVWATGDVITAEKLNNIESGIANPEKLVVTLTVNQTGDYTWSASKDKTNQEIVNAARNNVPIFVVLSAFGSNFAGNGYFYIYMNGPNSYYIRFTFTWPGMFNSLNINFEFPSDSTSVAFYTGTALVNIQNDTLQITAKELYELGRSARVLIYTSGVGNGSYDEIVQAAYSQNVYTFSTHTRVFTATGDDLYPAS